MTKKETKILIEKQREYFNSGATLPVKFRKEALMRLKETVIKHESDINAALRADLGKSAFEGYMCEIGMLLSEISFMLSRIDRFAKPERVRTPLAQFPSRSYKFKTPYGNTLIMSPWNYPILLTLGPLVDAIAAGNTAIVKPSAYSPATSEVIRSILSECFDEQYVAVITGGRNENAALLEEKFDLIFFTGSKTVGREVLFQAAKNLTPTVLELGGKSPCIVDKTADIELSARRIVFGKFLNCGQTCVAPDYILCDKSIKDRLLKAITDEIEKQFGKDPLSNEDYGKIISEKHFSRLCSLIDRNKVVYGGNTEPHSCRIAPTVMDGVNFEDAVMCEEIFGPILPIVVFDDFDEIYGILKSREKPLALYLFTRDKKKIKRVRSEIPFGGGCINDVVIHLATPYMGFGGVGESGMGKYHGQDGFDTFSHTKSIVDKSTVIDLKMRYSPYKSKLHEKLVRFFLK